MKHLIITTCMIGLSLPALATKRGDLEKPVAMNCVILQSKYSEVNQKEKITEVPGSEFFIDLKDRDGNNFSGAEKLLIDKNQSMEVSVNVTDHGLRNTIKIQVKEIADSKVVGSAFGDNVDDNMSQEVDVILSKKEAMNCLLIEKRKPSSEPAKPNKPETHDKKEKQTEKHLLKGKKVTTEKKDKIKTGDKK